MYKGSPPWEDRKEKMLLAKMLCSICWDSTQFFLFSFRLNEGHTVYLERHICGRLFGEKFRHFHALGGWGELQNTVSGVGFSKSCPAR